MPVIYDPILGLLRQEAAIDEDGLLDVSRQSVSWQFAAMLAGTRHAVSGGGGVVFDRAGMHSDGYVCVVPSFSSGGSQEVTLDFRAAEAGFGRRLTLGNQVCGLLRIVVLPSTLATFSLKVLRGSTGETATFSGEQGYAVQAVFYKGDAGGTYSGDSLCKVKYTVEPFCGSLDWN